jgi:cytoskeletal protein CcmA (bactofilin family)
MLVPCPHCGYRQREPRASISTFCRKCNQYFRVQDVLHPTATPIAAPFPIRRTTCFECGAELEVAAAAESTMCKRCGRYVDLKDYRISSAVSKNFRTKGGFTINPKGYVFNSEAFVGDAVIKGRFLGKLTAERSLTIYSTAEIKGSFTAARVIIPADNHFRWQEPIKAQSIEIAGELAADLRAHGLVILKATSRLFGDIIAGNLIVEDGAVLVGSTRIGALKA